jgi:FtsH-binding integral membrane protein
MYNASAGGEANSRMAWVAALNLYISFVALFQYLIQIFGQRN